MTSGKKLFKNSGTTIPTVKDLFWINFFAIGLGPFGLAKEENPLFDKEKEIYKNTE